MKRFQLERITGISVLLLTVIGFVMVYTLVGPGFTADQKTMVIQGALISLGAIAGYWLNNTADKPIAPGATTTTTTTTPPIAGKTADITTSTEVKHDA